MIEQRITVEDDGTLRFIYSDDLAALAADGQTRRASHVEPWQFGGWYVDLSPVGGPRTLLPGSSFDLMDEACVLALAGFATRQAALDEEVTWLRQNRGL